MLTALSIRDVVLIDHLDLSFGPGLTVLTGETGAGKSILLDSLGLTLGQRAEASLVRTGCEQACVTAIFHPPSEHSLFALLHEQGLQTDDEIVLRRIVTRDGRSRAFINDQPVSVTLLRRVGETLVEIQGQNEQIGLANPATHVLLLDSFGVPAALREDVARNWKTWRDAQAALQAAQDAIAEAAREEDWLRHATEELSALATEEGEEDHLAAQRQSLQQGERRAEAIAAALAELTPRDRRNGGPAAALRAASRALGRLSTPQNPQADGPAHAVQAALERAEDAIAEAENLLTRLSNDIETDPRVLENVEERLFALRAAARKHNVSVAELPGLLHTLVTRLAALDSGTAEIDALQRVALATCQAYEQACDRLSQSRQKAAQALAQAVMQELPPLRLDKARFFVDVIPLDRSRWGAMGADTVRFLIATNPGQAPGALDKVASGGELSRLMLALKVVLVSGSDVPTLVFDEVDSGVGGATAAAIGERLARVAEQVQTLLVTHSPQVAARGAAHLHVAKTTKNEQTQTRITQLVGAARREEIARMLAGETITEAARAAADSLLATP